MAVKIARDSDEIELDGPPAFAYGERVIARINVRNDGTFPGREVGDLLVAKGDWGYVTSIGSFLNQFYIYGVEFVDHGRRVGMKKRELVSMDAALRARAARRAEGHDRSADALTVGG